VKAGKLASASPTVSKGLESSAPVEKSRGPRHKPTPRGNSGPSLGHVSGEVRVHPVGPAAAGSGIFLIMSDSTRCDDKRSGGGGSGGGRDPAFVGILRFLGRCLHKWMKEMEGRRGGIVIPLPSTASMILWRRSTGLRRCTTVQLNI